MVSGFFRRMLHIWIAANFTDMSTFHRSAKLLLKKKSKERKCLLSVPVSECACVCVCVIGGKELGGGGGLMG